jgi:hypothetical protein
MRARLTPVALALAMAAAIFLLVWPVYSGFDGNLGAHEKLPTCAQIE